VRSDHLQPQNENETIIAVEGIERELTLVHITDSHIAAADSRDPQALETALRYQQLFQERTPGNVPAAQLFQEALERSDNLGADCTVLTGDITHLPTFAGLEIIERAVHSLQGEYLYTLGNHDWHFHHLPWNDETRLQHYPRFAHLTGGNPAAQVIELAGMRLIALDNSNYQVTPDQLDFLRRQLQTGEPCLLFLHIPLSIPSLVPAVVEKWQAPIVMAADGWTEETREKWQVRDDDESTTACHQLLTGGEADNLVGIFCGHVHFAHADQVHPGCFQYVTRPGFEGCQRVIKIRAQIEE
jgi:3',5'-cyclic AMP phosphodiesterase CpdA